MIYGACSLTASTRPKLLPQRGRLAALSEETLAVGGYGRPWHSLKRLLAVPRRYLADLFSCAEASHQSGPVSVSVSPAAIITKTDLDGIVCYIGALSLPCPVSTLHEASNGFKKKQTWNGGFQDFKSSRQIRIKETVGKISGFLWRRPVGLCHSLLNQKKQINKELRRTSRSGPGYANSEGEHDITPRSST